MRRLSMVVAPANWIGSGLSGVELYHVAGEDQIDSALLNDLHLPIKLAFVGNQERNSMTSVTTAPGSPIRRA